MSGNEILPAPPSRDLPPGRHEVHKERLMTLIDKESVRSRKRYWLRPVLALPALAVIAAGAVAVVVTRPGAEPATPAGITEPAQFADPHAGTPHGVTQLANRMALVAATRDKKPAPSGDWVYIKSKSTDFYLAENADTGTSTPVATVSDRQTWMSRDGSKGWLIQSGIGEQSGGESLDGGAGQSLNGASYDFLGTLPTDPDALLARIYQETKGAGNGPDSEAFTTVGDLLLESYPPAALYPALYRVAAKIPGVVVVDDSVDAAGRHGVALARVDELGVRDELIFDKTDYTFLGMREVYTVDLGGIKAGTVKFSFAILDRALVGTMKEVPGN